MYCVSFLNNYLNDTFKKRKEEGIFAEREKPHLEKSQMGVVYVSGLLSMSKVRGGMTCLKGAGKNSTE